MASVEVVVQHVYLSTACFHADADVPPKPELHEYCQSSTNGATGDPKEPGTCKFCEARCVCWCHRGAQ